MTENRYKFIRPNDREDYRSLAGEIAEASWPEFMLQDPIANENWDELFDRFEDYQFALWDEESGCMAAMANSLPFYWNQPLEDLPEGGWDWVFIRAIKDHKAAMDPNIQSAIQINIRPDYQSKGLSRLMVGHMRGIGEARGFRHLVAPVRPSQKSLYPLFSIDDYITWKNDDGLPFDAWLRVHVRAGGRIIKPCHESMIIRGNLEEWESWTGMKYPQSGIYPVPGALNPIQVDLERDEGIYVEPNVWMVHEL